MSYLNEKNQIEYYPNFGYPVELFVLVENSNINLYTKENLNSSDFIISIHNKHMPLSAIILKKLLFLGNYSLYDIFSWECKSNYAFGNNHVKTKVSGISGTVYNLIVLLSALLDIKLLFIQPHVLQKNIQSISSIYTSAVWLERENSEMFNLNYTNLLDSRRLLLDYTTSRGVLLKNTTTRFVSHFYKLKASVNFLSN